MALRMRIYSAVRGRGQGLCETDPRSVSFSHACLVQSMPTRQSWEGKTVALGDRAGEGLSVYRV